jgi:hypothetical protein
MMLAKCSNPQCGREFRELNKGRLFLLPPVDDTFYSWKQRKLTDHCYWLCPRCANVYTITLEDRKPVVREHLKTCSSACQAVSRSHAG